MILFKNNKFPLKRLLGASPVVFGVVFGGIVWSQSFEAKAQQAPRHVNEKLFFEKVRKILHRRGMTDIQFQTYKQIINYWNDNPGMSDRRWLAYVMATAYHETQLRPVREGFKTSDAAARKHVRWMYNKRIITLPYHRADRTTGHVYYGRGYVQLTWAANYKKMGRAIGMGDKLYRNPDLVLDPDIASKVLFVGMLKGHFRYSKRRRPKGKQKLKLFFNKSQSNWYGARNIINGDLRKNGNRVAGYGKKYNQAIRFIAAPDKPPVSDEDSGVIASPGEGEVTPSLPDTEVVDAPTTETPTPPVTETPPVVDTPTGDATPDGETAQPETPSTPSEADLDTAGDVVPSLPEDGELITDPAGETPQSGDQPTDVPTDVVIEGPADGDPEVLPIGNEERC